MFTMLCTIHEYSFDAWGRRRDKDDWTYTLTSEPALFADRGFTGHEYLEDFKLYNMNGRMYDPIVGRFLSPDPYVQDPGFTQNLNRYSYCLNNPLKFSDPSGELSWLYFLGQLAGNYLFNMADNTINKKMPINQAVKQFNFNMNYSPSSNRFFTPGVDAQMTAWNMETGQGSAYTTSGWWKQVNAYAGGYDDLAYKGTTWKYVPPSVGEGVINDVSDLTKQYTSPSADLFIGATESKIGQILLDRGKYGRLHPETIIRTPIANISLPTKLLQNTGTALKWGGRAFGAVGLVGTYAQWQTGAIGNTEAALDATFGAIGFFPGYGWAVSGTYFLIAKPLYNYYPKP